MRTSRHILEVLSKDGYGLGNGLEAATFLLLFVSVETSFYWDIRTGSLYFDFTLDAVTVIYGLGT